MVSIFYKDYPHQVKRNVPPNWDYIKRSSLINLKRVTSYYQRKNGYVKNTNIIVRMIDILKIDENLDFWKHIENVDNRYHIHKTLGMTSNISYGEPHLDFIPNSVVFFKVVDNWTYSEASTRNWEDLSPLKPIRYDNIDFNLSHPTNHEKEGVIVFELNIHMLMIQYRQWCLDRNKNDEVKDSKYFVYQYVLTNTIKDFLDLSFKNMILTTEYVVEDFNHPFMLNDLEKPYMIAGDYINAKLTNDNIEYWEAFIHLGFFNIFKIENLYSTRQSKWLDIMSTVDILYNLMLLLGNNGLKRNTAILSKIKFILDNYNNYKHENLLFDPFLFSKIEKIKKIITKRKIDDSYR